MKNLAALQAAFAARQKEFAGASRRCRGMERFLFVAVTHRVLA